MSNSEPDTLPREVLYLAARYRESQKRIRSIDRQVRAAYWILTRMPDALKPPIRWYHRQQIARYHEEAATSRAIRYHIRKYGYTASEISL